MIPDRLRAYLLGDLPASEREDIENRAFEDDLFDAQLQEAEADLLDDWARGSLSPGDARTVLRRFSPAKRNAALLLARRRRSGTRSSRRVSAPWLAAAAVLVACLLATYFWQKSRRLSRELESFRLQPPVKTVGIPEVATFALRVPATRGTAAPVFTVARSAQIIRLTADAVPGFPLYEMRIESAERGLAFSQTAPSATGTVSLDAPASVLKDGSYDILLSGRRGDSTELLASYSVRFQHP